MSSYQHDSSGRRNIPKWSFAGRSSPGPKDINTAPERDGGSVVESDGRLNVSKVVWFTRKVIIEALPALIPWSTIFGLIFGGCCSNVSL